MGITKDSQQKAGENDQEAQCDSLFITGEKKRYGVKLSAE